jgi:phosphoribosylglycinamide formyltransferase 1
MAERLATLISGGGTTMQEIIKACQSGEVPMEIACVISSSPTAGGIDKARKLGIPDKNIVVIDPNKFRNEDNKIDQEKFGLQIIEELKRHNVSVVTQNGWLPFTPEIVINEYSGSIFNQHPGPVPEFGGQGMYGRRVHAARLLFVRMTKKNFWTEVIAQRVDKDYDQGIVVKSARVDIYPEDTVDDLQQRALPFEHQVQIRLLQDIAKGKVNEVPKSEILVEPGEEETLVLAKKMARLLYPHG